MTKCDQVAIYTVMHLRKVIVKKASVLALQCMLLTNRENHYELKK